MNGAEGAAGGSGVPSLTQPWPSRGASCTDSIGETASFSYNAPFHSGRKQRHLETCRGKSVIIRTMYLEHQKLPQIYRVLAPKRGEQGRAVTRRGFLTHGNGSRATKDSSEESPSKPIGPRSRLIRPQRRLRPSPSGINPRSLVTGVQSNEGQRR